MKIILANHTELTPIMVTGSPKYTHGATRDTLNFIFAETSLDEMKIHFTETNCEEIKIIGDDNSESIYSGYVILSELCEKPVEITSETFGEEPKYENRVFVSMSQRTYSETQMASLTETVDILVLENLLAE